MAESRGLIAMTGARIVTPPDNTTIAGIDDRLPSGMRVREAVARAALWWDRLGRHAMLARPLVDASVASRMSGVLRGLPFDDLDRDEKLSIAKAWHTEHIARYPERNTRQDKKVVTVRPNEFTQHAVRKLRGGQ